MPVVRVPLSPPPPRGSEWEDSELDDFERRVLEALDQTGAARGKLESILKDILEMATTSNRLKLEQLEKQIRETHDLVGDLKTLLARKDEQIAAVGQSPPP